MNAGRLARFSSVALATLVACGASSRTFDDSPAAEDASTGVVTDAGSGGTFGSQDVDAAPTDSACRKMDIVFVIDNSFTMEEEQQNLRANFPKFVQVLEGFKTKTGELIDYRLAVTSTDSDKDQGAFRTNAGPARAWLERTDPDVSGNFGKRATLGTGGSSYERPLEALRLGLSDRIADGRNGAFLRPDALLAFVIVTDEDEGGALENKPARPVDDYLAFFDQLAGNRARWATALIAGLGPNKCTSSFGEAYTATRLLDFVQKTGKNAAKSSICDADLSIGLGKALSTFEAACQSFVPK